MTISPPLNDTMGWGRDNRFVANWDADRRDEIFERRVEDLVGFWCSGGTGGGCTGNGGMNSDVQKGIVESFGSIETLEGYIQAYAHWRLFDSLWGKNNMPKQVNLLEIMDELLAFPYRTSMDPKSPETVEWARFFVPYRAGGTYERRERLDWKGVKKLYKAGVPLEYAKALDTPEWGQQMPVRQVIAMHRAGISVEYARELLYGGQS